MENRYTFREHLKLMLVGVLAGMVSGLFFVLYTELKGQFNSVLDLFGAIVFTLIFYFIIVLFISYLPIKYLSKNKR